LHYHFNPNDYDYSFVVGRGGWFNQRKRAMIEAMKGKEPDSIRPILGTEQMSEPYLDLIDFYHLGEPANGPLKEKDPLSNSYSEQWSQEFPGLLKCFMTPYPNGVPAGQGYVCQDIPLLQYVYHPYMAVRMGGKLGLAADKSDCNWASPDPLSCGTGNIAYYLMGSEYLWGNIVELENYHEPLEVIPGSWDDSIVCTDENVSVPDLYSFCTNWGGSDDSLHADAPVTAPTITECATNSDDENNPLRGWHSPCSKHWRWMDLNYLAFLRKSIYWRTQFMPMFLIYGEMIPPAKETYPSGYITMNYNHFHDRSKTFKVDGNFVTYPACAMEHIGTFETPKVITSAFEAMEPVGVYGFTKAYFFLNNSSTAMSNVSFKMPDVAGASILVSTRLNASYTPVSENCLDTTGSCRRVNSTTYTLTLPSREIVVIRYAP